MKKKAQPKRTRAPGGGRKPRHGEPTVPFSTRLPQSVMQIAKTVGDGNATHGMVLIVKQSEQYQKEYGPSGADQPSDQTANNNEGL